MPLAHARPVALLITRDRKLSETFYPRNLSWTGVECAVMG